VPRLRKRGFTSAPSEGTALNGALSSHKRTRLREARMSSKAANVLVLILPPFEQNEQSSHRLPNVQERVGDRYAAPRTEQDTHGWKTTRSTRVRTKLQLTSKRLGFRAEFEEKHLKSFSP
jgi:hypothetical protein